MPAFFSRLLQANPIRLKKETFFPTVRGAKAVSLAPLASGNGFVTIMEARLSRKLNTEDDWVDGSAECEQAL